MSSAKAEHHEVIRGSVGHYGLSSSESELKTPLPLHLNHTHSVYVAVGTLISGILLVAVVVCGNLDNSTMKNESHPA